LEKKRIFLYFVTKLSVKNKKKFQEKQKKKLLLSINKSLYLKITISFLLKKTQELILKLCKQRKSYQKKKFSLIFANSNDKKRKKRIK